MKQLAPATGIAMCRSMRAVALQQTLHQPLLKGSSWLSVDGPGFARLASTVLQSWSGAAICPAFDAALMAAGPNAIRGSGPNYQLVLEAP
jgi:hypothetical protein